ncbi:hypothetical protein SCHPADRAFT_915187 [Schizopora paradoxa]|uniref:Fungal pheromone STE3G-protein-coupled receptor n=1 Tax=Schizopora paradoxa TaxID=27342 RepID=A0A0H2RP67_9AGAM|nr:hypothetical protein SCHPADRAFT_915187 [Schizopora paradoxa]
MSFAPPGESISDIRTEQSLLDGTVIAGAAYGIHLTLFVQCFQLLCQRRRDRQRNWGLLLYICIIFSLGTVGFGGQIKFNEMTFIQDRDFPGGPLGFNFGEYNAPANLMTTAAFVILNWFADGLLIYRLYMIWNNNLYVAALPILTLLGSFTVSVLLLFQLTQPGASLWTRVAISFGIPYWSISISLNVIVTLLIVARLLYMRRVTRIALTPEHASTYTSIVAILIESAALYSTVGLIFVISYARNSMVQNVLLPVLGHIQAVSPLLIILRVARGVAWDRRTIRATAHYCEMIASIHGEISRNAFPGNIAAKLLGS